MSAAEVLVPEISEPLTWTEICERYPDEWVFLVEMDRDDPFNFEFRTARVISHGKTRNGPVAQAMLWRDQYPLFGHYFTGGINAPHRPRWVVEVKT